MSSFGDGNIKTRIEEQLSCFTKEYSDNFSNDEEAKKEFLLDVLEVLVYICEGKIVRGV